VANANRVISADPASAAKSIGKAARGDGQSGAKSVNPWAGMGGQEPPPVQDWDAVGWETPDGL
jgi:hypothetical protein